MTDAITTQAVEVFEAITAKEGKEALELAVQVVATAEAAAIEAEVERKAAIEAKIAQAIVDIKTANAVTNARVYNRPVGKEFERQTAIEAFDAQLKEMRRVFIALLDSK